MIAGYLGHKDDFDQAVAAFALGYADITDADHLALVGALTDGSLEQHGRP